MHYRCWVPIFIWVWRRCWGVWKCLQPRLISFGKKRKTVGKNIPLPSSSRTLLAKACLVGVQQVSQNVGGDPGGATTVRSCLCRYDIITCTNIACNKYSGLSPKNKPCQVTRISSSRCSWLPVLWGGAEESRNFLKGKGQSPGLQSFAVFPLHWLHLPLKSEEIPRLAWIPPDFIKQPVNGHTYYISLNDHRVSYLSCLWEASESFTGIYKRPFTEPKVSIFAWTDSICGFLMWA